MELTRYDEVSLQGILDKTRSLSTRVGENGLAKSSVQVHLPSSASEELSSNKEVPHVQGNLQQTHRHLLPSENQTVHDRGPQIGSNE